MHGRASMSLSCTDMAVLVRGFCNSILQQDVGDMAGKVDIHFYIHSHLPECCYTHPHA